LLERAVTDLPANALAWNHLGLAYQGVGRPDEARKAYLRALEFDRNLFDVHFNLGALEFEATRWTEAERALRTYLGVEKNRTNAAAWRLLGEAQLATQQLDAAERTLAIAVQLAPNDPSVRNRLGLTLAQKRRWREAQSQFTQVVRQQPDFAEARLNLAVATQQLGDRRGSLEHYQAYLALNPPAPAAAAVELQIQQLEAVLAPALVIITNAAAPKPAPPAPNTLRSTPVTNVTAAPVLRPPPTPTPTPTVSRSATNPGVAPVQARPITNPPVASTPVPKVSETKPSEPKASEPKVTEPKLVETKPATPPPIPPPPVEVVPVEEPPPLQIARDTRPPAQPTVVTTQVTPPPNPASARVAAPTNATARPTPPADSAERRTFWQRVNPVAWGNPLKWFRNDDSETNRPPAAKEVARKSPPPTSTPPATLPLPATTPTLTPAVVAPAPRPTPPVRPAPQKPVIARYPAGTPPVLTPGNRAAAESVATQASTDRLAAWRKAVQLDPSWSEGWQQIGRLALESGRPRDALSAGEAAVTLEPNSAATHQLFAAALSRSGYPADAAEQLERAVTLAPGNAPTHLALAGIYARDLVETSRARPHYEQVLALDPQHPQAAAIQMWLAANP